MIVFQRAFNLKSVTSLFRYQDEYYFMIHAVLPRNLRGFAPQQFSLNSWSYLAANGVSFLPLKHEDDCNFYFWHAHILVRMSCKHNHAYIYDVQQIKAEIFGHYTSLFVVVFIALTVMK